MVAPITRKLHRFEALEADDAATLEGISRQAKTYSPHSDLIRIGSKPGFALVIVSGWAARYTVVKNGSRQITAFLLPGDFCHLNIFSAAPMDHSIAALSHVAATHVPREEIERLFTLHPGIARAVQASQFADESRLRASITGIGRQSAAQRLGYMLCDVWVRAGALGLIEDNHLKFPLTQTDVADYVGLTSVHVNRVMKRLRSEGQLELRERYLFLPDFEGLARLSGYNATAIGSDRDYEPHSLNGRGKGPAETSIGNNGLF